MAPGTTSPLPYATVRKPGSSSRRRISGRPLTVTGGHWWCNEEADGVGAGVRAATRQLLKDGADFIKIMASGGGTRGTDLPAVPRLPSRWRLR